MARTLKQSKTMIGSTSSSLWTWKQIVYEYFEDNYIDTNKSIVIVESYLGRPSGQSTQSFGGGATTDITCDSDSRSKYRSWIYNVNHIAGGGWFLIQSEEFEIEHSSDGTKEITISSTLANAEFNPNSASASGTMVLTTIPRASSISVSNYDLGQNPSIVIGKKSDSFTSTLTYKIGSRTGTIVTKTSEKTYVWKMSSTLINQIKTDNPSTKKISATVYCKTYSGSTQVGSQTSATFYLTIVDKPTITDVTRKELNTYVSTLTTKVLKSISQNQFTIIATAPTGTTIKTYNIENGTQKASSTSNIVNLNDIQTSYTSNSVLKTKFVITCTDARGNTSEEYPLELDFIKYVNVSINKTDTKITRSSNISNDAFLNLKGNFYNGKIGDTQNALTIKYKYREKGTSTYSSLVSVSATYSGNTFKITNLALSGEFNYQKNYEFVFYVTDSVNDSDTYNYVYASSIPTEIHHDKGAYIRELDADSIKLKDISILDLIHPIGSVLVTSTNENPSSYLGGSWTLKNKSFLAWYFYFALSEGDQENLAKYVTSSENATINSMSLVRNNNTIYVRIHFTTLVALTDTTIKLGQLNLNALGLSNPLFIGIYGQTAISDGGNGIALIGIDTSGNISTTDIITKNGSTEITANNNFYLEFTFHVPVGKMLDSHCNRFFWLRTA